MSKLKIALFTAAITTLFSFSSTSSAYDIEVENLCKDDVELAIRYLTNSGSWRSKGWWTISAGERTFLSYDGVRLSTDNGIVYIYGEAGRRKNWQGDNYQYLDGKQYGFMKFELLYVYDEYWDEYFDEEEEFSHYIIELSCGSSNL